MVCSVPSDIWYLLLTAAQLRSLRWHSSCGIAQLLLVWHEHLIEAWLDWERFMDREYIGHHRAVRGAQLIRPHLHGINCQCSWFELRTELSLLVAFQ